jgi:hypothetical protein
VDLLDYNYEFWAKLVEAKVAKKPIQSDQNWLMLKISAHLNPSVGPQEGPTNLSLLMKDPLWYAEGWKGFDWPGSNQSILGVDLVFPA